MILALAALGIVYLTFGFAYAKGMAHILGWNGEGACWVTLAGHALFWPLSGLVVVAHIAAIGAGWSE